MITERIRILVEMDRRELICRIRILEILVIPGVDLDKIAPSMLVLKEVMMDIHEVAHKVGLMAIPVEDHREQHLKTAHNRPRLRVEQMVTHEAGHQEAIPEAI